MLTTYRNNQEELDRLIGDWTRTHTNFEVMEVLQPVGVAAGPSLNMEEIVNNPHLQERGFYIAPDHPEVGQKTLAGLPWKLSDSPARVEAPPVLGGDNEYVFCELLGMSNEEFATLVGEGVIA